MSRKVRLGTVSMILNNKLSGMEYYNNMVESAEQILTEAANEKPESETIEMS
jgi:hypothetical protein